MKLQQIFCNNGLISEKDISKDHIRTKCWIHGGNNSTAMSLNFKANRYKCFNCGVNGSIIDLMLDMDMNVPLQSIISPISPYIQNKPHNPIISEIPHHLINFRMRKNLNPDFYLNKRGITSEIARENYIYYSEQFARIYIPVFFNNKCYGYMKRTIINELDYYQSIADKIGIDDPSIIYEMLLEEAIEVSSFQEEFKRLRPDIKYLNDRNLPKNNIVYEPLSNFMGKTTAETSPENLHDKLHHDFHQTSPETTASSPTLLVEGALDCLYANQMGFNAMAIIGGGISTQNMINSEVKLIDYIVKKTQYYKSELILCFDNDKAGKIFTSQFRKLSNNLIKKIDYSLLENNQHDKMSKIKDLQDINKNQLNFLISHASLF